METKKTEKTEESQSSIKRLTLENLVKDDYISEEKAWIASHEAKVKVVIGAKQCGKTFIGIVEMVINLETDPWYNGWAIRKHSSGAVKGMGTYIIRVSNELSSLGYKIKYEYKLTQTELYRLKNKRNMSKNQIVNFSSLEDYSGSTDGKPVAFGYIGDIIVDEAVIERDALEPDKIPTKKEWDKAKTVIDSNLSRYTSSHKKIHPELVDRTKETCKWYFMNNWGPHPEIVKADEVFPELEFIEWVFGWPLDKIMGNKDMIDDLFENEGWVERMISRNTKSFYYEEEDILYTRMTVFANPMNTETKFKTKGFVNKIRRALEESNFQNICIFLGLRQVPQLEDNMRVYPEQVIKRAVEDKTFKEYIAEGYEVAAASYGVDVDISRVITITPSVLFQKTLLGEVTEEFVFVDKQIEIICAGAGVHGRNLDQYTSMTSQRIVDHIKDRKLVGVKRKWVLVDENLKFFLRDLTRTNLPDYISTFGNPIKTGKEYNIEKRQDIMITGLTNRVIRISPENSLLFNDMRTCEKRNMFDRRRVTEGTKNYLDRIDSSEYSVQPFTPKIWKLLKGGKNE